MACSTRVSETVCVQADVVIVPDVTVGTITTSCRNLPFIGRCSESTEESCTFSVSQRICIEVPLTFAATATATPSGIVCGDPVIGGCTAGDCVYSKGYYKNHEDVTLGLIQEAGIPIGILPATEEFPLSFLVTDDNAIDVLDLNPPASSIPTTQQYQNQYANLYAQLLAAILNVTRIGEDNVCEAIITLIAEANTFIATSPAAGKADTTNIQDRLEASNTGNLEGCPEHCTDEEIVIG